MNKLNYGYGSPKVPKGIFKISPSSLKDFYGSFKHLWFRQNFMQESKFEGNSASVKGTLIHWMCEQYAKNGKLTDADMAEGLKYVSEQSNLVPEVDEDNILSTYSYMWEVIKPWLDRTDLLSTEEYTTASLTDRVIIQGQVDYTRLITQDDIDILSQDEYWNHHNATINNNINNNAKSNTALNNIIIGDYKTHNDKYIKKSIEYAHKLQARAYAYAMRENGTNVTAIEITYIKGYVPGALSAKTGNIGKSYPAEVTTFLEPYTDDTHALIKNQLMLVAETMEFFFDNPDKANILFHDQRFKDMNMQMIVDDFMEPQDISSMF